MEACRDCLRRSWLLATLSVRLDHRLRDPEHLVELLDLGAEDLIAAIGGRRRAQLTRLYEQFESTGPSTPPDVEQICRHDQLYPAVPWTSPRRSGVLSVAGGVARMRKLLETPVVAIAGTRRPTDYGIETARHLAHGLAASGITVAAELRDGIGRAAHEGALGVNAQTISVMAGGVDVPHPVGMLSLRQRVLQRGCALSMLPCGMRPRRWCELLRARLIVACARLVIVVEADESLFDLFGARVAQETGIALAAVPGRVTSPASRGTNLLLNEGVKLICDTQDVLDLIYGFQERRLSEPLAHLDTRLHMVLERVGSGEDTLSKLMPQSSEEGPQGADVMLALAELELMGLLGRGDGGRYVLSGTPPLLDRQ